MRFPRQTLVVAATYVYFLIFAQFGFLEHIRDLGPASAKAVLGAMALGGLVTSLCAPFWIDRAPLHVWLTRGFVLASISAAFALIGPNIASAISASILTGIALGLITVTLSTSICMDARATTPMAVGLGTGLAYAGCNLPYLFHAQPTSQIAFASCVALLGALLASQSTTSTDREIAVRDAGPGRLILAAVLLAFAALVWFDSAAFYWIQQSRAIKLATWTTALDLARNSGVHLVAATLAGIAFARGQRWSLITGSALALVIGYRAASTGLFDLAGWLYPAGVSVYSVLLVLAPRFILETAKGRGSRHAIGSIAGTVFAIAGWCGSGLGIGMVQDLGHVPPPAPWILLALVTTAWLLTRSHTERRRILPWGLAVTVLLSTIMLTRGPTTHVRPDLVDAGRAVYIREGCIQCHSQYVRPSDVMKWGPQTRSPQPSDTPLYGNRRLGPDLSNVGLRRDRTWQRLHLKDPRQLVNGSRMPAYEYLFRSDDGEALVAYLMSLGSDLGTRWQDVQSWQPSTSETITARRTMAAFAKTCAPCHGALGMGNGVLAQHLAKPPRDLRNGVLYSTQDTRSASAARTALARTIKFGLPGGMMPGHEYMDDATVLALADLVQHMRVPKQAQR